MEEIPVDQFLAQGHRVRVSRTKARGKTARRQPGKMNRLEASYARHLDARKAAGEVLAWWFERVAFRVGTACFWHADFLVQVADGTLEIHDCKGYARDDATVKARAVADEFPFDVYHVTHSKKDGWRLKPM